MQSKGPGTELKAILAGLDIHPTDDCPCEDLATQMDAGGVPWCNANRAALVAALRAGAAGWGWGRKVPYMLRAAKQGLWRHINPLDPYPGLVALAISRAT